MRHLLISLAFLAGLAFNAEAQQQDVFHPEPTIKQLDSLRVEDSVQTQDSVVQDSIKQAGRPITVYYGVIMDPVRKQLDSLWDTTNADQVERGYCIGAVSYNVNNGYDQAGNVLGKEIIARVWTIYDPVKLTGQTPMSIDKFECEYGHFHLHTHPPTTCDGNEQNCVIGGMNAWQCQPSRTDYETLVRSGDRFGVIQCDKHAYRFYWPSEYRP